MKSVSFRPKPWGHRLSSAWMTGMWKRPGWLAPVLVLLTACLDFGQVEQGRVVAFSPEKKTFLMVRDVSEIAGTTDYSGMPPVEYVLPDDPEERGPSPTIGNLLDVDPKGKTLTVYDPATQSLRTLSAEVVSLQEQIGSKHVLVYDRSEKKARSFPQLDKDKGTLTLYLKPQKQLVTFALTDEMRALPESSWIFGDEVRIYFKQPPATLRYMNVSKTDIFSK